MLIRLNPYMVPLVIAVISSGALAIYSWRQRHVPAVTGAISATILMLAITEWLLSYTFEIGSDALATKILWSKVKYFGVVAVPMAWLCFSLQFTRRENWLTRRNLALLTIEPAAMVLLVWTNDYHSLIWSKITLEASGGFLYRASTYGPLFRPHTVYSHLLLLFGGILVFKRLLQTSELYRKQALLIMVALLAPWIGNGLYVTGLNPFPFFDLTPFGIAFTGLPVTLGLLRLHLFDILPVARGALIESMTDRVIVLDGQGFIVDLNPAAQVAIGVRAADAVGKKASKVFSNWPGLVEGCRDVTEVHSEIALGTAEKPNYFDLRISPLLDKRNRLAGRLMVLRDITERKQSEALLQKAHDELEQRVGERTTTLLFTNEKLKREIEDRKRAEEALRESEEKYRTIIENIEDGYYEVDLPGNLTFVNESMCRIFGYPRETLIGVNNRQYTDKENARKLFEAFNKVYRTGEPRREYGWEIIRLDRNKRYIEASISLRKDPLGRTIGFRGIVRDITERKRAEEKLRESEERFRQLAEQIREVFYVSEAGTIQYVSPAYQDIWGRTPESLYREPNLFLETVHPEDRGRVKRSLPEKGRREVEEVYRILRPDASIRWVKDRSFPIYDGSRKVSRVVGIAADITDLKNGEEKLKYLSLHDSLTGLYNRIFFEEEMSRIEKGRYDRIGILSCDVDGLKLVNDTLGHGQGDKLLIAAARVIEEAFREGDLVARIGGDEFSAVLPHATETALEHACQRIQGGVETYNATNPEFPLSISAGFAIRSGPQGSLKDTFKEADNNMYRKKLYRTQSVRSTIVKTLINTLKARDLVTERHVTRVEKLLVGMAALIGLPESTTSDLSLFAKFHDIGKVAIPDSILFKKGPLTSGEWVEMKRHSEIGYRIALSAPDLIPIADWILRHHEWWNGKGYPLGIRGEETPIECRLLAIVDAYEAMTSVRPYRRAFLHNEAVAELSKYSGTQFDPDLTEKFLKMIEPRPPWLEPAESYAV